jgi:hypothetical protein
LFWARLVGQAVGLESALNFFASSRFRAAWFVVRCGSADLAGPGTLGAGAGVYVSGGCGVVRALYVELLWYLFRHIARGEQMELAAARQRICELEAPVAILARARESARGV